MPVQVIIETNVTDVLYSGGGGRQPMVKQEKTA
jgi:hypothetical protein